VAVRIDKYVNEKRVTNVLFILEVPWEAVLISNPHFGYLDRVTDKKVLRRGRMN
jgi:hypothetical protein